MRFLVDECTGPAVAQWPNEQHHDVLSVHEMFRGATDDHVLEKAVSENRILVTNDKDFGELIIQGHRPHSGVILLRLANEVPANKIVALQRLLEQYSDQIEGNFVVVTELAVRIIR